MFRLVMLVLLGIGTVLPVSAADYEINLSALDALGGVPETEPQLPLPVVKSQSMPKKKMKPRQRPSTRVKKSVEPFVKRQSETVEQKTIVSHTSGEEKVKAEELKTENNAVRGTAAIDNSQSFSVSAESFAVQETENTDTAASVSEPPVKTEQNTEENIMALVQESDKKASETAVLSADETANAQLVAETENISSFDGSSAFLVFDAESAELTDGIIRALTAFAGSMDVQNPGKILIEAYNYDGGEGSFSRKRLSLNRAVAVRSWLLGKGYKSFGIKIINTEDVSLQNNMLVGY